MTEANQSEANFAQVALTHLDGLYGYGMSLSHNRTEAEDLVQETYLRAVRAFGQLAPDSNLKSWLYAIMRNIWLNQVRHAHSGPQFVEIDDEQEQHAIVHAQSSEDPLALYINKVERAGVRTAVENLPQPYREVIVLREFEGLSYQEIAGILHCPAGTVMSRLGRARDKLRLMLSSWKVAAVPPPLEANNP